MVSDLRRSFLLTHLAACFIAGCTFQREAAEEGGVDTPPLAVQEAVAAMLHASAASWNEGDLDGFMDDYWRSGNLTFSGSRGMTRGWEEVRQRYRRSYWAEGAVRDSLRFEDIEVTPLGEEHALALGRYVLYQPDLEEAEDRNPPREVVTSSGFFSLVLHRFEGQWKIIHDHTSAMEMQNREEDSGGQSPPGE